MPTMPEPTPDHRRADLQHVSDRHAKSRPNTAYKGSSVSDGGGGLSLVKLVWILVVAIVVWQLVKFLMQR